MKQQEQDSITRKAFGLRKLFRLSVFVTALFFLSACTNDIEHINDLTNELDLPSQSGRNIEVQYTDSCRLKLIFKAPEMQHFVHHNEEPYYEFPKGIEVLFYDKDENLQSRITANWAMLYEDKQLWVARDSVVARNIQTHEELTTEELFWNQEEKRIYSHVFTKIVNPDGVYYGEKGFESDQDFNNYKLIGSSGTVNVKDDQ